MRACLSMLGLSIACACVRGAPILMEDFEAQTVGAFPGSPWVDVSTMIDAPTLPSGTGSVIETTGIDGGSTRAYQIAQASGTSTGILAEVGARRRHSLSADVRIDHLPSRNSLLVWTGGLGLFQESAASDLNFGPQAVVYVAGRRWYLYVANGPGSSNSRNVQLSSQAVAENLWYSVSLEADTLTGEFRVSVRAADGSLTVDRGVAFGDAWDPAQGAFHRVAAFDGEYATTATAGQFTVDNVAYAPSPAGALALCTLLLGRRRR